jgi:hypothetical protein
MSGNECRHECEAGATRSEAGACDSNEATRNDNRRQRSGNKQRIFRATGFVTDKILKSRTASSKQMIGRGNGSAILISDIGRFVRYGSQVRSVKRFKTVTNRTEASTAAKFIELEVSK